MCGSNYIIVLIEGGFMPIVFTLLMCLIILIALYFILKGGMYLYKKCDTDFEIQDKKNDVKEKAKTSKDIEKFQKKNDVAIKNEKKNEKRINEFLNK